MSAGPIMTTNGVSSGSDTDTVEYVVRRLNQICKAATLEFTIAVGSLVTEHLFGGDFTQWRSRDPTKAQSLRKLARHPALPMSPSALYRSIAIFELCKRLDIKNWRFVSTSHLRRVLSLPEQEQGRLLRLAEANAWTVRQLDEAIEARAHQEGAPCPNYRGGRKRRCRVSQAARRVAKSADALKELLQSPHLFGELSEMVRQEVVTSLRSAADTCALLERRMHEEHSSEGQSVSA